MTKIIRVAISASEPLFRKGLELVIGSFADLTTVATAIDQAQLIEQITISQIVCDIMLIDWRYKDANRLGIPDIKNPNGKSVKLIFLTSAYEDTPIEKPLMNHEALILPRDIEPEKLVDCIRKLDQENPNFSQSEFQPEDAYSLASPGFDLGDLSFTKREMEVLKFICEQYTTSEIAEELYISPRTVDGHRNNLLEKTNSKNTAGLVVFALQNQIVDLKNQQKRG